ncbi:unnamed protein product [Orchesella dallaii]|uniref:Uncharacterized protein n=1 Tax=Orchesella dallaii TaxID=48710 RepID=A0ABP1RUN0_9HEXA
MYLQGKFVEDCSGYNDIHQYYPNWVAAPCENKTSRSGDIPLFFAATMLVLLMCGAVLLAVIKQIRDKNLLQEWSWNDRKMRKRAASSTVPAEFWRMTNSHSLNPLGDITRDIGVSPPATPSTQNASPPPSFHMTVPPPPPYGDCIDSTNFESCIET